MRRSDRRSSSRIKNAADLMAKGRPIMRHNKGDDEQRRTLKCHGSSVSLHLLKERQDALAVVSIV